MEPKTVRKLEKELHKAIVDVICRLGLKKLPLLPFSTSPPPAGRFGTG